MSSLSQLYSQESEKCVYDPNDMPCYQTYGTNLVVNLEKINRNASLANFFNAYDPALSFNPYGFVAECTIVDTYVVLADVINPKGGYLYYIVLPTSTNPNGPVTVKITVDGVVYEKSFENDQISIDMRYVIGDVIGSRLFSSSGSYNADYEYGMSAMNKDTTAFLPINRATDLHSYSGILSIGGHLYQETFGARLKFFNTLKIEVKTAWLNSDVDENKTCAYIKTF